MSEAAKEAAREYKREWRKKNPDKVRMHTARYWERKAAQMSALKENEPNQKP